MKWFALVLLLLINVVYCGWELLRETNMAVQGVRALKIPAAARQLSLLNELPALPALREAAAMQDEDDTNALALDTGAADSGMTDPGAADPGTIDPGAADEAAGQGLLSALELSPVDVAFADLADTARTGACFSLGPIPERPQADKLSDWFTARNARAAVRHKQRQARRLFWIYLAPQQSRQTALAMLDELKGKGISDYRLIGHGSLRNAISLGLFSSQAAIAKRLGELQQKGYRPVVVPYDNVRRIYWVDVQLPPGQGMDAALFKGQSAPYKPLPVACSQIARNFEPAL